MGEMMWQVSERIPGGVAHALVDESGRVRAAGFGGADEVAKRLGASEVEPANADHPVAAALRAYAAGDVRAFEALEVEQTGSEFRQQVWAELRRITPGEPITYTELAQRVGRPAAVRAAASACANNLVAIIVPCHRVIRTDGTLGGYLYGLAAKEALLAHEATFGS